MRKTSLIIFLLSLVCCFIYTYNMNSLDYQSKLLKKKWTQYIDLINRLKLFEDDSFNIVRGTNKKMSYILKDEEYIIEDRNLNDLLIKANVCSLRREEYNKNYIYFFKTSWVANCGLIFVESSGNTLTKEVNYVLKEAYHTEKINDLGWYYWRYKSR